MIGLIAFLFAVKPPDLIVWINLFAMGGLGDLLITGIKASDYPVVQSVTLLMVFIFLCINLLVDILYAVIDPRIRMK